MGPKSAHTHWDDNHAHTWLQHSLEKKKIHTLKPDCIMSWYEPNGCNSLPIPHCLIFLRLRLWCILVNRCKYVIEIDWQVWRSVTSKLFKLIFFLFVCVFGFFFFLFFLYKLLHCLAICHKLVPFFFAKYQKYFLQNTAISHIGKTKVYCSVLPAFSIKFFFWSWLKYILAVMWWGGF